MSNRLDKLFKEGALKHHLPNSGPDWDALEVKINSNKKKPLLFFGLISGILTMILFFIFFEINKNNNITSLTTITTTNNNSSQSPSIKDNIVSENKTETNSRNKITSAQSISLNSSDKIIDIKFRNSLYHPNTIISKENNKTNESLVDNIIPKKAADDYLNETDNSKPTEEPANTDQTIKPKSEIETASAKNVNPDSEMVTKNPTKTSKTALVAVRKIIPAKHLIAIYISYAPSIIDSKNSVADFTGNDKVHKEFAKRKADGEKMKNALGFNFGIRYAPFRRISISGGVFYEKRTEMVQYDFLRKTVPVTDAKTGEILAYFTPSDSAALKIFYNGNNTYNYIGIPINISINAIQIGKIGLGFQISSSYLRQTSMHGKTINSTYLTLDDLTSSGSYQLKSLFNAGIGFDLSWAITRNLILNISPNYKTQLTKNSKTTTTKQSTLNLSLQYFIF